MNQSDLLLPPSQVSSRVCCFRRENTKAAGSSSKWSLKFHTCCRVCEVWKTTWWSYAVCKQKRAKEGSNYNERLFSKWTKVACQPPMACWFSSTVWFFLCSNLLTPSWSCHHSVPPCDLLPVTRHSQAVCHGNEWKEGGTVETGVVLTYCNRSNCSREMCIYVTYPLVCSSPLEVESKILEYVGSGQKGAAHAGKKLPVAKVCSSVWGRCVAGLFH